MKHEKSCGCIIVKGDTVLVEKQKHKDERFWNFPKGHQDPGETDLETALRETKEEVGLDVEITDNHPITMTYLIDKGTTEKIVHLFLARLVDQNAQITLQEEEVEEARWVPFAEVESLLTFERSKIAWQEALSRLAK